MPERGERTKVLKPGDKPEKNGAKGKGKEPAREQVPSGRIRVTVEEEIEITSDEDEEMVDLEKSVAAPSKSKVRYLQA